MIFASFLFMASRITLSAWLIAHIDHRRTWAVIGLFVFIQHLLDRAARGLMEFLGAGVEDIRVEGGIGLGCGGGTGRGILPGDAGGFGGGGGFGFWSRGGPDHDGVRNNSGGTGSRGIFLGA